MEKVIIYGNGKISKIIYTYIKKQFEVVAFCVEKKYLTQEKIENLNIHAFEDIETHFSPKEFKMIICIGYVEMNEIREKKYLEAKKKGYSFINYIHPSIDIHDDLVIGENNIILDHVSIQPKVSIGNSNIIWSNTIIAHGSKIKDTNWITSGVVISGDSQIASKCFLGVNATIGHNCIIENKNFIGANALITKSSKENEVYITREAAKFRLDSERFLQFTGV